MRYTQLQRPTSRWITVTLLAGALAAAAGACTRTSQMAGPPCKPPRPTPGPSFTGHDIVNQPHKTVVEDYAETLDYAPAKSHGQEMDLDYGPGKSPHITIQPECGSHLVQEADLRNGRIVAKIEITKGPLTEYSSEENDTVYWWMYFDPTSQPGHPDGRWRSVWVSKNVTNPSAWLEGYVNIICHPDNKEAQARFKPIIGEYPCVAGKPGVPAPPADTTGGRTGGASGASNGALALTQGTDTSGTERSTPWYSCIFGCCQSAN